MLYAYIFDHEGNKYDLPTDQIQWVESLNAATTGTITVPYSTLSAHLGSYSRTVWQVFGGGVVRIELWETQDNSLIFEGLVSNLQMNGTNTTVSNITLQFQSRLALLNRRLTWKYQWYKDTEVATIVTDLINYANSGLKDTGITIGSIPVTRVKRDRLLEYENVYEVIKGMSNEEQDNGFDYELTANNIFNLYFPTKGQLKSGIVFDERRVQNFQSTQSLTSWLTNVVQVKGQELESEGGDPEPNWLQVDTNDSKYDQADPDYWKDVRESQSKWGIHEEVISATDIFTEPFMRARGRRHLEVHSHPQATEAFNFECEGDDPDWRSYQVGDVVKLQLPWLDYDKWVRIKQRTITNKLGHYRVSIILQKVSDYERYIVNN